jgi:Tfp pilus assembly protein PilN
MGKSRTTKAALQAKVKKLQAELRALKRANEQNEHVLDAEQAVVEALEERDQALADLEDADQELEELRARYDETCVLLSNVTLERDDLLVRVRNT